MTEKATTLPVPAEAVAALLQRRAYPLREILLQLRYGKTPMLTFKDSKHLADAKMLDRLLERQTERTDSRQPALDVVG